jgi:hypothetical protein
LLFHPLPSPSDEDVAHVARAVSRKVSRILARHRSVDDGQASLLDDLANASVQGMVATGPRRGCQVLRLGTGADVIEAAITSKRCADVAGFNVHANVRVRANDRERLEHLVKYEHSTALVEIADPRFCRVASTLETMKLLKSRLLATPETLIV